MIDADALKLTLSPTELEVLQWAAYGKDQEAISIIRGVAPSTTHGQMYRIRTKLGADNAAHAVAIAMRAGIIK